MQLITLAVALATLAQASPVQDLKSRASGEQLATFDDLVNGQPIPVPYNGLGFADLTVSNNSAFSSIVPQSPPNYARASAASAPTLTILGTDTTSFDLDSFYIGCYTTFTATGCNFTITGITGPDSRDRYGPIPYSYTPTSDNNAPMMEITPGWDGLLRFEIRSYGDDATNARTYFTIDNVRYTTYE